MNEQKKLRIIAGPNGSGKSTFIEKVRDNEYFQLHNYINSDEIQKIINVAGSYDFNLFPFQTSDEEINLFFTNSGFKKRIEAKANKKITELYFIENKIVKLREPETSSYFAAMIADFLRNKFLQNDYSFEYETVMSHESKIEFLKTARSKGYKVYLYFLCCPSPQINKINVANRVKLGGHFVDPGDIENRYFKTLSLLKAAIDQAHVAYIIENTFDKIELVAHLKNNVFMEKKDDPPTWFQKYYLEKI